DFQSMSSSSSSSLNFGVRNVSTAFSRCDRRSTADCVLFLAVPARYCPHQENEGPRMDPIDFTNSLFSGASQIRNFQTQREIWPTARRSASPNPLPFPKGVPMALPATYTYGGASKDLPAFIKETETMALVVIKDGVIRHESYADWGGPDTHWVSMSVAKSFVSAAIGIALDEGLIKSIEQP